MANSFDRQISQEGPRNAVVKITGIIDTADMALTPAIALSDCINNDTRQVLVGFRVDLLEYSIANGLEVLLAWNSASPQQIFPLAGRGRLYAWNYGGFSPDRTKLGYDGSINLVTSGFIPGSPPQNFSIVLELVKLYTP